MKTSVEFLCLFVLIGQQYLAQNVMKTVKRISIDYPVISLDKVTEDIQPTPEAYFGLYKNTFELLNIQKKISNGIFTNNIN